MSAYVKTDKKRADELLAAAGLARSRSQAQALIMAGEVAAGDRMVKKAGELWPSDTVFSLKPRRRFVSRGGYKLEGALADLQVDPTGLTVLDIGASTGGFTDCLLQHGADRVTAVDVGRNLLDQRLLLDQRVTVLDGINARRLADVLPEPPENMVGRAGCFPDEKAEQPGDYGGVKPLWGYDLAVMDVSFISLELILPQAARLVRPATGRLLAMVKPQFEVGREKVGKKGVVRDPLVITEAVDKISALGPILEPPFIEVGRANSRLTGPEGNQEVFVLFHQK